MIAANAARLSRARGAKGVRYNPAMGYRHPEIPTRTGDGRAIAPCRGTRRAAKGR
ncbi:MAG TPA: hypothetical protein VFK48_09660 [Usitatibacter sp.]|nr:hypothetical protein [Usitatibacter sp.]